MNTEYGTAKIKQTSIVDTELLLQTLKKWLVDRNAYRNRRHHRASQFSNWTGHTSVSQPQPQPQKLLHSAAGSQSNPCHSPPKQMELLHSGIIFWPDKFRQFSLQQSLVPSSQKLNEASSSDRVPSPLESHGGQYAIFSSR